MTIYNKLVRDNIPEMICSNGEKPNFRILSSEEYLLALEQKLDEEAGEFHRDKNAEELADILEVVFALADAIGCSREELMKTYQDKHHSRGGFEKRYYLFSKE